MDLTIERYGEAALLVPLLDQAAVHRLFAAVAAARLPGVTDVVPGAGSLVVRLDPSVTTPAAVAARLQALPPTAAGGAAPRTHVVPVVYDGPDLADVAAATGLAVDEVVRRHQAATWTVAFLGFTPGFGYLTGDDPALAVPRRPDPRPAVPAGAVALAGRMGAVYPSPSPGGWQLVGRTDVALFDAAADPPALLAPGDVVRFRAVPA